MVLPKSGIDGFVPPGTGRPPNRTTNATKATASNPQLITSTGGLLGLSGALLTPININQIPGPSSYVMIHDSNNFDCEEDSIYYFRQEVGSEFEGQYVEIGRMIIKYRELGKATFSIGISAYQKTTDDFKIVTAQVSIPSIKLSDARKKAFPDGKIHVISIAPPKGIISGINPQAFITRKANSGPLSITKLVLCTYADEVPQI